MKNLLLITSLLAVCYFKAATSACACDSTRDCSVAEDGQVFADSSDCSRYVVCYAGRGIRNACPHGFLFDSGLQMCNPARYVDCGNRLKTETTTTCAPVTQPPCDCTSPSSQTTKPTCETPTTPCQTTKPTTPCQSTEPSTPCHSTKPTTPCQSTKPSTPCPSTKPPCTPTPCTPTKPSCETTSCASTASTTVVPPEGRVYVNSRSCAGLKDGTTLRHRTNIRRYYVCKAGSALRKLCKRGEFFDAEEGKCSSAL